MFCNFLSFCKLSLHFFLLKHFIFIIIISLDRSFSTVEDEHLQLKDTELYKHILLKTTKTKMESSGLISDNSDRAHADRHQLVIENPVS